MSQNESYVQRHEKLLSNLITHADIPAERLKEAIKYALLSGGKRLRPLLVYLTGEVVQLPIEALDSMAAAIECMHCYSLVHDDLPAMDNDDLRRGKPSCHKAYDEATAILVGDALQALAIEILLTELPLWINHQQVIAVSQALLKACGPAGMVSGQSLDLSELTTHTLTEPELQQIHHLKTGKLILACIDMVLAASQITELEKKALRDYASHLGLAFQMQDDYLDAYADIAFLGKGRSSDQANQKTTYASLYSQTELLSLVNRHFQLAMDALQPFNSSAEALLRFTQGLQARGQGRCINEQRERC